MDCPPLLGHERGGGRASASFMPPTVPEHSHSSNDGTGLSAPPAVPAVASRSPPPHAVVEAWEWPEPPSSPPLPLSCASNCRERTCAEWLSFAHFTCSVLTSLDCDCSGCCLHDPPTRPPPPPPPPLAPPAPPPPPSSPPIPTSWPEECGNSCRGKTCRAWLEFGMVSCSELRHFGCPCRSCCVEDPPPPPAPPSPHYPPVDYGPPLHLVAVCCMCTACALHVHCMRTVIRVLHCMRTAPAIERICAGHELLVPRRASARQPGRSPSSAASPAGR